MMLLVLLLCLLLGSISAETDPLDVEALKALYGALNSPPQLRGWKSEGGDPCGGEIWHGVSCSGKSVTCIRINGMGIGGSLGSELSCFKSLKELDVRNNYIGGEIPDSLPPNATHLHLSCNQFVMNKPFSLLSLESLSHLNLSHNYLSGPIGNVFSNLDNLKQMDLSFNNFSGSLPSSFSSLTHLHALYLQENQFTGSVDFLANLPLSVLNLENNHFSGVVPKQFQSIQELWIDGNMFQSGYAFPPPYNNEDSRSPLGPPVVNMTPDCNISHNPIFALYICGHSSSETKHKRGLLSPAAAGGATCALLFLALVAVLIIIYNRKSHKTRLRSIMTKGHGDSFGALPVTAPEVSAFNENHCISQSLSMTAPRPTSISHTRAVRMSRRKISSRKVKSSSAIKTYSASDLIIATDNYNDKNLLGESLFGSVYRADIPDGQACVVKKLEMLALSMHEEDMFMDFVWHMSHLKHPSITRLLGYSVEQGQHALVYEYIRNGSLDDLLHSSSGTKKILPWRARVKIALGVARALEYMHWTFCPPIAHDNLKGTNVLLDDKLMPHLSDCGLPMLRPFINIKPKASKYAVGYTGYSAPESGIPGTDKTRSDVYSFGVLLLELLTGRKAFDSSKGKQEQSLVRWASSRLHDIGMLEGMADPAIKCTITSKALSRFADIIVLCIQSQPEFRPPMTEIADMLVRLVHKLRRHQYCRRDPVKEADVEVDVSEMSYGTTLSHFE